MTPITIAVVGILGAWFLATAIVQLPWQRCRRLRRFDPTGHLLPGWNFFAPKPIQADFAVWYRAWDSYDRDREEVLDAGSGAWRELAGIEQRRVTDGAVNPGRYTRKSIFTCCSGIARAMRYLGYEQAATGPAHPPDAIMISLPYLLLAEKVTALCADAVAVQFRIDVIRHERGSPRATTVFRSAVHRAARFTSNDLGHVAAP